MTDISKCANRECSLKISCWRYKAPEGAYQSWIDAKPNENGECDYYIERLQEKQLKILREF